MIKYREQYTKKEEKKKNSKDNGSVGKKVYSIIVFRSLTAELFKSKQYFQ